MGFKLFIGSVRNIDIIGVELEIDFMSGIGLSTSFPWNCIFHPIPKSQKGEMIHLTLVPREKSSTSALSVFDSFDVLR